MDFDDTRPPSSPEVKATAPPSTQTNARSLGGHVPMRVQRHVMEVEAAVRAPLITSHSGYNTENGQIPTYKNAHTTTTEPLR